MAPPTGQYAENRRRQQEIYGAPLGERVHRLTAMLGVSQARLAHALGLSPSMLSQLVCGRRVKVGDPAVLARLRLLDARAAAAAAAGAVEGLLAEVAAARWQWAEADALARPAGPTATTALRALAHPARLVAAAALLGPAFPELAALLRAAAGDGVPVPGPTTGDRGW